MESEQDTVKFYNNDGFFSIFASFQTGQLNEYTERKKMPSEVMCMALGNVAVGEQRSWFLAVGLQDNTVRIISLDPSDCLAPRSMQALPAAAESLCIVEMGAKEADNSEDAAPQQSSLYLNIGKLYFQISASIYFAYGKFFIFLKKIKSSFQYIFYVVIVINSRFAKRCAP